MSCETRVRCSAPGKIILLGEHAVVYGEPAIAAPVSGIRATATASESDTALTLSAIDLKRRVSINQQGETDPLVAMLQMVALHLDLPDATGAVELKSDIPVASGMGSSAAVSAAVARAIAQLHRRELPDAALNQLVYAIERLHHGTPSGIDNTVVVYEKPIIYARGAGFDDLSVGESLHFLVADSSMPSSTREAVAKVRRRYDAAPGDTRALIQRIGQLASDGRRALAQGDAAGFGRLMTENHEALRHLLVSSRTLDALVDAAIAAGCHGAKLSGGGMGGNMIALVDEADSHAAMNALSSAGASRVLRFSLGRKVPAP